MNSIDGINSALFPSRYGNYSVAKAVLQAMRVVSGFSEIIVEKYRDAFNRFVENPSYENMLMLGDGWIDDPVEFLSDPEIRALANRS